MVHVVGDTRLPLLNILHIIDVRSSSMCNPPSEGFIGLWLHGGFMFCYGRNWICCIDVGLQCIGQDFPSVHQPKVVLKLISYSSWAIRHFNGSWAEFRWIGFPLLFAILSIGFPFLISFILCLFLSLGPSTF